MEPTTPTLDDLVLSLFRVYTGSSKIGSGPGRTDKVRINYYSKNLLIYSHFQEKINEVQIKALADFEDRFETFSGLLAPLPEDLKQLLCGDGEDDCCVFEVDVTVSGCLGVWVDVSIGSEVVSRGIGDGEDDCCVFEVDVTGSDCLGVWVDVSLGSEVVSNF
nr:enzymatic polyprotein [Tanacetum cinerariifolium]